MIKVEALNIQGLIRNRHLSQSIADMAWGEFFEILSRKVEETGGKVRRINPRNTSQNCSRCGEKVPKKLSERVHRCDRCGLVLDRDYNAALNIVKSGVGRTLQAVT